MRPIPYLLTAAAILLPLASMAQTCPLTLPRDAVTVRGPAGWRGYSPSDMRLTGFGMMGGDPQSMTYLVPAKSAKTKSGGVITWTHPQLWLFCTYDDSAAIQISRQLEGKSCTIRYTKKDGAIISLSADCR